MGNVDLARRLIADLRAAGAAEFCVCAGSRNAPLLAVLASADVRLFSFVDERSAAFFALGRTKLHGNPVAVVTTSGTAVAEMLPAAIEAFYSGAPLVLVSADRPARFRGTGAPQAIEQVGLFGPYAETSLETWTRARPLHVNLEFDEPLVDCEASGVDLRPALPKPRPARPPLPAAPIAFARPLLILGGLAAEDRARARRFARALDAPTYAEPLSGLREDRDLPLLTAGERILQRGDFDGVIRVGNVPTLRFWRDLETLDLPVVHFSALPFTGLTRGELHPIEALPATTARDRDEALFAVDRDRARRLARILDDEPQSELALLRELSREVPEGARIYLGNSLPVREWDLVATREPRGLTIEANRGANGIDGQLSTFFGQCDPARDNVCVVGDLTAIHDLGAPWIAAQLADVRFRIVVVNNGGGRIFSRPASSSALDETFRRRFVENSHALGFDHWARMWNVRVSELRPDAAASQRVWQRYDELWA